jgi:hypothetical protein
MRALIILFVIFGLAYCGCENTEFISDEDVLIPINLPLKIQRISDRDDEIAERWNEYFGSEVIIFVDENYDCSVTAQKYIFNDGEELAGQCSINFDSGGINNCGIILAYYVVDSSSDSKYRNVLSHEIGHAFGKSHTEFGMMKHSVDKNEILENLFDGEFADWINDNYLGGQDE